VDILEGVLLPDSHFLYLEFSYLVNLLANKFWKHTILTVNSNCTTALRSISSPTVASRIQCSNSLNLIENDFDVVVMSLQSQAFRPQLANILQFAMYLVVFGPCSSAPTNLRIPGQDNFSTHHFYQAESVCRLQNEDFGATLFMYDGILIYYLIV